MFYKKANLNSKPNNPNVRTSPQEVCDSLSKSSPRCNLGLTWDQTNFFASKSLASGRGNKPGSAQTVQPPLKSPQILAAAKLLSNYAVQLQCLQCAPGRRVTENAIFSAPIVGLDGPRTRATRVAQPSTIRLQTCCSSALISLSLPCQLRFDLTNA
jgi:hypothetical protein